MDTVIVKLRRRRSKKEEGLAERTGSDYKARRRMAKIDRPPVKKKAPTPKKRVTVTVTNHIPGGGR